MKWGSPPRSDRPPRQTSSASGRDFVKDADVKQNLENCVKAATEEAFRNVRGTAVMRKIRAIMNQKGVAKDAGVELMLGKKSKASRLAPLSPPTFMLRH